MKLCFIKDCNNKHHAKGLCQHHKNKLDRHGDPLWMKDNITEKTTYNVWRNMKSRCNNDNNPEYKNYGGRGIKVCNRWNKSFIDFYNDMGSKPFKNAEIDRKKNNKGYSKNNCRWISHIENNRNKRTNVIDIIIARKIRKKLNKTNLSYVKIAEYFNIPVHIVTDVCLNRSWVEE